MDKEILHPGDKVRIISGQRIRRPGGFLYGTNESCYKGRFIGQEYYIGGFGNHSKCKIRDLQPLYTQQLFLIWDNPELKGSPCTSEIFCDEWCELVDTTGRPVTEIPKVVNLKGFGIC